MHVRRRLGLAVALCVSFLATSPLFTQAINSSDASKPSEQVGSARPLDAREYADAPILIVTGEDNAYSAYYEEILKAEGLNIFASAPAVQLGAETLKNRTVVLLATSDVSAAALPPLQEWTRAGGLLIAMRPNEALLQLAGLKSADGRVVEEGYLVADPALALSRDIARQPLRIHGRIQLYEPLRAAAGAGVADDEEPVTVAGLRTDPKTALPYPAVAMRSLGQGHIAVVAFDLARSVVLTRQGNPNWAHQERGGPSPRRPSDLFFPGYLDVDRIGVPQADEQQRLLANLIVSTASAPLPRFWYLPNLNRAAIVMAGDDHGHGGTARLFGKLAELSPAGCRLAAWECYRATAYVTPKAQFPPALAMKYRQMGFEVGAHVDTGCRNENDQKLSRDLRGQVASFQNTYRTKQVTHRIHCLVRNGWAVLPKIERDNGIRLDLNYYHWPPRSVQNRPGFLTGSGFPMPYAAEDGAVLDIYQGASHLVNESGVPQSQGVAFMLQQALGPAQYFGAFGAHFDYSDHYDDVLIAAARQFHVPLITAEQLLTWTDGRNRSRMSDIAWRGSTLQFAVRLAQGAEGADVVLPASFGGRRLASITCDRQAVETTLQTIKGLDMALFAAPSGRCEARYRRAGVDQSL